MKRLFTLIAAAMVFVGGYAQTVEWNFSDAKWINGATKSYDYTETTTMDGLTIYASSSKKVSVDAHKKTVDGVSYTQRLKLGGAIVWETDKVTPATRAISFTVTGSCHIYIVGAHSGKTTDSNRSLTVESLVNAQKSTVGTIEYIGGADPKAKTLNYNGEQATIILYTTDKGINLYDIKVTPTSSSETITIGNAGFATYCSANAVDYSSIEGLTAYAVKYADNKLVYTPITGVAKANTPVLLQGEAKEYTLTASTEEAKEVDTDLKAATSAVTGASNIYALANKNNLVAFYQVSDQTSVPAGKCYLEIPASENGASAKAFFALDTEATGISNVATNSKIQENGVAYSLSGQRVGDSYKGIVIINGKKVIRK